MSIAESAYNLLKINSGEISPAQTLTPYKPRSQKAAKKTPKKKHIRRKSTPAQIPAEPTPATRELKALECVDTPKGTNSNPERVYIESKPVESINNSMARKNTLSKKTPQKREADGKFKQLLTLETFDEILNEVSETGISVKKAAEKHGTTWCAVIRLTQGNPDAANRYASARMKQADTLFARIVETAEKCDGTQESFNRSRLLIDALKWTVSKLNPAKYSDKANISVTGADGGPVTIAAAVVNAAEVKAVRDMLRSSITTTAEEVTEPEALTASEVE